MRVKACLCVGAAVVGIAGCGGATGGGTHNAAATSECAYQADGHVALVVFRSNSIDISHTCSSFQQNDTDWRPVTLPSSFAGFLVICRMSAAGGAEKAVVYDTGLAMYGQQVCGQLTSAGWTQPTSAPSTP